MTLSAGTRLGPYVIEAPVGAGGMGEVYKARDTRLDRIVAIKVAQEQFSERFEREARAVAALNHPHICTLHDVGPNYLVMEYLEGTPLKGPLPLDQALKFAAQISDALDAAHRKSIVHRDLKPDNILVVRRTGSSGPPIVKLLDFGLAKIEPTVAAGGHAMTMAMTGQGQIVGTLHYMSPEQLQGGEAGPPSDIFSFGIVLYELLTGRRAFDGTSPASVIAAILERPAPSVSDVAPSSLDRLLRRCLAKDPGDRWQSARDLKAEIEWIAEGGATPDKVVGKTPAPSNRLPWAVTGALVIALGAALWAPWRTVPEAHGITFDIQPNDGESFVRRPVISPDGRRLAILSRDARGTRYLALHSLDSPGLQRVQGTDGMNGSVSWSPDSRSLVFTTSDSVKAIDVGGGQPRRLASFSPSTPGFTAWSKDGAILFTCCGGVLGRISSSGGEPTPVTVKDPSENVHLAPQFLPDGRHFLYFVDSNQLDKRGVFAGSLDSSPEKNHTPVLGGRTSTAFYARGPAGSGYLIFELNGALVARSFDVSSLQPTGEVVPIATKVGSNRSLPFASTSDDGVLAFSAVSESPMRQFGWFDRNGKPLGDAGPPGDYAADFALSLDDRKLAVSRNDGGNEDIYILDLDHAGALVHFTTSPLRERGPIWSPDGHDIAYSSGPGGAAGTLFRKPVNGREGAQQLLDRGVPLDWSRDGRHLLYSPNVFGAWVLTLAHEKRIPVVENVRVNQPQFSPDGKWIAYGANTTKRDEVWVRSFPPSGEPQVVSTAGGSLPRWRYDGRELFYLAADERLMAVGIKPGDVFQTVGSSQPLFNERPDLASNASSGYAVSRDGHRFLISTPANDPHPAPVTVVTNWWASLRK